MKHKKNEKIEMKQFNVRIRPEFCQAADIASAILGQNQGELVELAIKTLVEDEEGENENNLEKVRRAWKSLGMKLPFRAPGDSPLGLQLAA